MIMIILSYFLTYPPAYADNDKSRMLMLWRHWYRLDSHYLREYRSIKHLCPTPCWRLFKNTCTKQERQKTTEQGTDVSVPNSWNKMFHRKYQTLWINANIFASLDIDGRTREKWQINSSEHAVFVINYWYRFLCLQLKLCLIRFFAVSCKWNIINIRTSVPG